MRVSLRHPGTGNFKFVETGWSWPLFMSSGLLGLPLFFRGLALWGTVMTAAWSLSLVTLFTSTPGADALDWAVSVGIFALCVFFGMHGNALTAKHWFSLGYEFTYPDSADARAAARSWGLYG